MLRVKAQRRFSRIELAALAVAPILIACASATGHRVVFLGESTGYRPELTPSIYVLPHTQSVERSLDIASTQRVARSLEQVGYQLRGDTEADLYLAVEAYVDSDVKRQTLSVIRPAQTQVVVEPDGKSRTIRIPERSMSLPVSVELKYPRMTMSIVDAKLFREKGEVKILWHGEAILSDGGLTLDEAMPYLLVPLVSSFGTQSKGIIRVDVSREMAMGFK